MQLDTLKKLMGKLVLVVSVTVPWAWFTIVTFVARPLGVGSFEQALALVGEGRAVQALVYLAVGFVLALAWMALVFRRSARRRGWLFTPWSVGRVAKWAATGIVFGYLLTVLPAAALVADDGDALPTAHILDWGTRPWLIILGLSISAAIGLAIVDLIGGTLRKASRRRLDANSQSRLGE